MCIFPPLVIFASHRLSVRPNYIHPCVIAITHNRLPDRPLSCATCHHVSHQLSIPIFDFFKTFSLHLCVIYLQNTIIIILIHIHILILILILTLMLKIVVFRHCAQQSARIPLDRHAKFPFPIIALPHAKAQEQQKASSTTEDAFLIVFILSAVPRPSYTLNIPTPSYRVYSLPQDRPGQRFVTKHSRYIHVQHLDVLLPNSHICLFDCFRTHSAIIWNTEILIFLPHVLSRQFLP